MRGLAQRFWASLTDTDVDSLNQLVEQGRRRDGPLWRRYLVSLLDAPVVLGGVVRAEEQVERDPPTSTIFYTLEGTVDVGTAPPTPRHWWRATGFALAVLLVIVAAFAASRLLSPGPTSVTPMPPAAPPTAAPAQDAYHRVYDPVGYTFLVSESWTRTQKQGQAAPVVFYNDPADGRELQIFRLEEETPADSLDAAENDPGFGFARQPGYMSLERDAGTTWAEVAYRYDDEDKGRRTVIDHRFQADDGELYAMRASGPETRPLALLREPLVTAVSSFCAARAPC